MWLQMAAGSAVRDSVAQKGQRYLYSGSSSLLKFLEFWESNVLFFLDDGKIRLVSTSP